MATELKNKLNQILNEKTTKIIPENIKDGVTIFDVTGTLEEGVDTSDANATANDIVTNKTAYVNGQKLTGTYTGIVPTGTKQITENGTVDVSNFANAEVNVSGAIEGSYAILDFTNIKLFSLAGAAKEISDLDLSNLTNANDSFYNMSNLQKIGKIKSSSSLKKTVRMFAACMSLKNLDLTQLITSSVTDMNNMFQSCSKLENINFGIFDTSLVTNMYRMFYSCGKLTYIKQLNTNSVTNMSEMFVNCTSLSNESLNNILGMCIGATSYTGTKTLAYLGLTSNQATICQSLSNWDAFVASGWTTGY
jgi:surface protein